MNWQVERLVAEWLKHGTLIIACDYDDTLCPFQLKGQEHEQRYDHLIGLLLECQNASADIILNTASAPDRWTEMRSFCEHHGLRIADVNHNMPGLKYGHHGKVYANIYLDDRAGIGEATNVLREALDQVIAERAKQPATT